MSQSKHNLEISAKDNTAAAFQSIEGRAAAAGNRVAKIMGGAIAAAGAYLSFRSVKGAIDELGNLSDVAMKAGTSVEALTQTSLAVRIAGLNMPVENLTRAFQYLAKQTGEGGVDNFYKTAQAIAAIEDPAKRGAELVRTFGRAGLELQPLIDGGENAIAKMRQLTDLMPGVSQAAADAGDEVADSMTSLGTGLHNMWLKIIGRIVGMWSEDFPGGVRAGALNAVNWFEWALKRMYSSLTRWGAKIGLGIQALYNLAANDYSWDQAWDEYDTVSKQLDENIDAEIRQIDQSRAAYVQKLRELSVDDLANAYSSGRKAADREEGDRAATTTRHAPRINNPLITAGSYAQQRLAILGPDYQNEAKRQTAELKKQNELLKKVVENTAKAAEESAETVYQSTDLGA